VEFFIDNLPNLKKSNSPGPLIGDIIETPEQGKVKIFKNIFL
jgi:hypothetical protein